MCVCVVLFGLRFMRVLFQNLPHPEEMKRKDNFLFQITTICMKPKAGKKIFIFNQFKSVKTVGFYVFIEFKMLPNEIIFQ